MTDVIKVFREILVKKKTYYQNKANRDGAYLTETGLLSMETVVQAFDVPLIEEYQETLAVLNSIDAALKNLDEYEYAHRVTVTFGPCDGDQCVDCQDDPKCHNQAD